MFEVVAGMKELWEKEAAHCEFRTASVSDRPVSDAGAIVGINFIFGVRLASICNVYDVFVVRAVDYFLKVALQSTISRARGKGTLGYLDKAALVRSSRVVHSGSRLSAMDGNTGKDS